MKRIGVFLSEFRKQGSIFWDEVRRLLEVLRR